MTKLYSFLQQHCSEPLDPNKCNQLGVGDMWALVFAETDAAIFGSRFVIKAIDGAPYQELDDPCFGPILVPVAHYNVADVLPYTKLPRTHNGPPVVVLPTEGTVYERLCKRSAETTAANRQLVKTERATDSDWPMFKALYEAHCSRLNNLDFKTVAECGGLFTDPDITVLRHKVDGVPKCYTVMVEGPTQIGWIQHYWNPADEVASSSQVAKVATHRLWDIAKAAGKELNLGLALPYKSKHWHTEDLIVKSLSYCITQ